MLSQLLGLVTTQLLKLKLTRIPYLHSITRWYLFSAWHIHLASPLFHPSELSPCPQAPPNLFLPSYWPFSSFIKPMRAKHLHSVQMEALGSL